MIGELGALVLAQAQIGAGGDCEAFREPVGQVVNTLSSVAMSGFGIWLWLLARRWDDNARRRTLVMAGVALISTGIGSALYHGPGGFWSGVAHDVTIAAIPLAVACGLLGEQRGSAAWRWFLALMVLATACRWATPLAHYPTFAIAFSGLCLASFYRHCQGLIEKGWLLSAAILFAAARVAFHLSRTDGVLCWPDSPFQGHALWHLLVGATVVAAARGLTLVRRRPVRSRTEVVEPARSRYWGNCFSILVGDSILAEGLRFERFLADRSEAAAGPSPSQTEFLMAVNPIRVPPVENVALWRSRAVTHGKTVTPHRLKFG